MNLIKLSVAFSLLATCFCATAAESTSPSDTQAKVVPVLVQVNSHGKVTGVNPGVRLSPKHSKLLRKNLAEMITKPALDRHGEPMSSQFVMNLSLQTAPRADGQDDSRFEYVSTSPVPAGSWHWASNGQQLGIARDQSFDSQQSSISSDVEQPIYNLRPQVLQVASAVDPAVSPEK